MEAKPNDEFGMVLVRKNYWKPWAHTWIKPVQETIHYHKWPVRKSWKQQEEINQIGQCNQEQSLHGSQAELLTSRAVIHHHQRNILQVPIEILETKYILLANSKDSIYHQVLQEFKNKYHICTQQWLKVSKHSNQTIIISKK